MKPNRTQRRKNTTRDLTLTSSLAAVYVVSTFLPLTAFIGGAAFITAGIVMVPVIAAVLRPVFATIAILAGSIGTAIFQTGIYAVFGPLGLLVPILAAVLGSFAFHHRWGEVLPWAYVLAGLAYYILYSQGGTLFWLTPYVVVITSLPLVLRQWKGLPVVGLLALYTTMTEQVTMNILSISLLGLVDGIWTIITPFMILERTIATVASFTLIVALKSRFETAIQLGQLVHREVS